MGKHSPVDDGRAGTYSPTHYCCCVLMVDHHCRVVLLDVVVIVVESDVENGCCHD